MRTKFLLENSDIWETRLISVWILWRCELDWTKNSVQRWRCRGQNSFFVLGTSLCWIPRWKIGYPDWGTVAILRLEWSIFRRRLLPNLYLFTSECGLRL